MTLSIVKKKDNKYLYIVKKVRVDGKPKTVVIQKCGKLSDLEKQYDDPIQHFKDIALKMSHEEKEENSISFLTSFKREKVGSDKEILLNGGYLFLQKIYRALRLNTLIKKIKQEYKIKYDLDKILQDLIYSRIIFPGSKRNSFEDSKCFIEKGDYELHDVYRSLTVLNEWFDKIQSFVYKSSENIVKRNKSILYYDCTNFFFEIEYDDELRKHGISKEHRPNPLVQMGLFMDANGIPLAIDINPGNTNEQITLRPFEQKVLNDFNLSKVIVCTDAGLASYSNRVFNDSQERSFIVTQPIKKLRSHLKEWCLNRKNFTSYIIDKERNKTFYKSISMKEKIAYDLEKDDELVKIKGQKEWRIIVTYSEAYAEYQRTLRENQITRAKSLINNPTRFNKTNAQDCKRFIKNIAFDKNGEIVKNRQLIFDSSIAKVEERYDGFYAVCTNLEGKDQDIVKINKGRWEIEESFKIMKTNLKSRPVYVSLKEHIRAHFLTCFLALLFVKIIDEKLEHKYSINQIITSLRKIQYTDINVGYMTSFKTNDCILSLIKEFNIECDYNAYTPIQMRKLINSSLNEKFATSIKM